MSLFDHSKYIPDRLNAASVEEIFYALKLGLKEVYKQDFSFESIVVLLAHSALETGRWKVGLHRWNFGNVKAYPDKLKDGEFFTLFRCGEILNGKEVFFDPPHPQCAFRAYKTRDEGISEHLKFLQRKRYAKAWQMVLKGDPAAYAHELRVGGYYTANEKIYTKTLVKLFNEYAKKKEELMNWEPEKELEAPPLKLEDIPIPYEHNVIIDNNDIKDNVNAKEKVIFITLIAGVAAWIASLFSGCF